MVSSDTVVGIVGAVILTGAMIAVFYYEAGRDAADTGADLGEGSEHFTFAFRQDTQAVVDGATGSLSQGESTAPMTFELPAYPQGLHAIVSWTATAAPPPLGEVLVEPEFRIEIFAPNATTAAASESGTGEGGAERTVEATLDLGNQEAPANLTVAADSAAQAQQTLDDHLAGMGEAGWSYVVTLVSDGYPEQLPGETRQPIQFSVTIHADHWADELQESA